MGNNLRHNIDLANTYIGAIFGLQGKLFPFVKLYKSVSVNNKQCMRCLTSLLNRIYNGHAQKCPCLCDHSPTDIEGEDTMMILAEMYTFIKMTYFTANITTLTNICVIIVGNSH